MNDNRIGTVLLTDRAWPDDHIEREVLAAGGFRLVTGPPAAGSTDAINALVADHQPDGILTCWAPVSAEVITHTTNLRVITRMGVGLDDIMVDVATRNGVQVTNVPDYCVEEVSDHAVALVLSWARGIVAADRQVHDGHWDPAGLRLRRLSALTCGVIGFGRIGRATVTKLRALGSNVLVHTRTRPGESDGTNFVDLDELLRLSDVVILHVPLSDATRHLIGAQELALLPQGAYLVNVGRGALVDTGALIDALQSGHLAGAGLDMVEEEPCVPRALLDHAGVTVTPHIAFSSDISVTELRRRAAQDVVRVLTGKSPLYPCNYLPTASNGVSR